MTVAALLLPGAAGPRLATADGLPSGVTDSAMTVVGDAAFPSLHVTVGQTRNLVNQVVTVSWTGGTPTIPANGSFGIDYLQLMQCWGDAATGPDRSTCAFGGNAAFETRGGDYTSTRQLNYGGLIDPLEPLRQPPGSRGTVFAPFASVTGKTVSGNANEFVGPSSTNEIAFGRTRGDGTGQEFFEIQTDREDQGLGCGAPHETPRGTSPRGCWLVAVPRGHTEVDGSVRSGTPTDRLDSSPLSTTNWSHRLAVRLSFEPVGGVCQLGAKERSTVGVEAAAEAIARWQPTLCQHGGTIFSFSQVGDSVAERQLLGESPGLAFLSRPLPPASVPAGHPIEYAPVALSALTLSFVIESQAAKDSSNALKRQDGTRITSLNLTPRLVAKLLTQSYGLGVSPFATYLKPNPQDLTRDPEFLAINPAFATLNIRGIPEIITPAGLSDAAHQLWSWVASDNDARDFVAGVPDQYGMRVNPFFHGMSIPRDDFPKLDPFCVTFTTGPAPLCTLDAHPYADDRHVATRAVSRGDSLSRSAWDPNATPPVYKKSPPQPGGQHALIALSDTAVSARYATVPARLRNAAGNFVAPDEAGLLAGLQAMRQGAVAGFLAEDPATPAKNAYPLTTLTFAATAPDQLSRAERADYANLLLYAVGAGQKPGVEPGTLPEGFVPLPDSLREPARAMALRLRQPPPVTPSATATATAGRSADGATSTPPVPAVALGPGVTARPGSAPSPVAPAALPPVTPGQQGVPAQTLVPAPALAPALFAQAGVVARTPADRSGVTRYALVAAIFFGGLAALAAQILPRLVGGAASTALPPGATAPPEHHGDSPRTAPERPGNRQGGHFTPEGNTS